MLLRCPAGGGLSTEQDPLGDGERVFEAGWREVEDGVALRLLRWTPRAAAARAPVLFVAGWVSVVEGWAPVLEALTVRRPVVYVETREKRSARFTRRLSAMDFTIARLAEDLRMLAAAEGLADGRAVLFGSSMGANAILEALKGGRLAVRAAFVVGPNATFHVPWWGHGVIAMPPAAYGLLREPLLWYLRHYRVDARSDPEQMRRYERTLRDADARRLKLSARAVANVDTRPGLETVTAPVAVAYAPSDVLHGADEVRDLVSRIPAAEALEFTTNSAMHSPEVVDRLEAWLASRGVDG